MEESCHIRRRIAIRATSESTKNKAIMTMLQANAEDCADLAACLVFTCIGEVAGRGFVANRARSASGAISLSSGESFSASSKYVSLFIRIPS